MSATRCDCGSESFGIYVDMGTGIACWCCEACGATAPCEPDEDDDQGEPAEGGAL